MVQIRYSEKGNGDWNRERQGKRGSVYKMAYGHSAIFRMNFKIGKSNEKE